MDQLDHWRNFAAYKLEQRIDPLIGMCLSDILDGRFKRPICKNIIPEFPFPSERLLPTYNEGGSFRCDRIDFAAFCPEPKILYLVELKTDSSSVSEKQLDKLQQLAENSKCPRYVGKWIKLIAEVAVTSDKPRKYIPILNEILKWKLVTGIDVIIVAAIKSAGNNNRSSLNKELINLESEKLCSGVTIVPVLIAPKLCIDNITAAESLLAEVDKRHNKIRLICLARAADALSGNNELHEYLAEKLREWNNPQNLDMPSDDYLKSLNGSK